MSTVNVTARLRHLLLGTMFALTLAFAGTAAASAAPLKLICESGDQRCVRTRSGAFSLVICI